MSNDKIRNALATDLVIDITTIGRKSGQPRRIEIWFHRLKERYFITGTPGRRDWYANLVTNPEFTFHLKERVQADIPAVARPVTETVEREAILRELLQQIGRSPADELDAWLARSPLVEVMLKLAEAG